MEKNFLLSQGELKIPCKLSVPDDGGIRRVVLGVHGIGGSANDRIQVSTEQAFAATTMGYTSVIPEHTNVHLNGGRVRYALLPVWILTTRYQNQVYTFAMNGQTGKMVGNLPIDWKLFWTYLVSIGLGSGALISAIACLFG